MIKVAINGFGRIGRSFLRMAHARDDMEIIAVNDLGDLENLAYLLRYDSAQGKLDVGVHVEEESGMRYLVIGGKKVRFLNVKNPSELPWKELAIDIAVESTGLFASYEKSRMHLDAGARRVVVSAPVKDEPPEGITGATVLMGINEEELAACDISSNASCTTNAASPIVQILEEALDIEKALLDTIHGYTSSQSLVDAPSKKDFRRGRAAAQNIIPSTTGAAIAVTKAVKGVPFFDGIAVRVPVIAGSYADLTFVTKKHTSAEEVNGILRGAAKEEQWQGIFTVTEEPVVSSDIIGNTHASIADLAFTRVVGGNLVKVLSWYDNEMGYTKTLVEHVIRTGSYIQK